uniref:Ovule protein n=1 Tax=Heterorhabditis bacteriophora TaxID=37862 RepID=A0A1I7WVY8_HETBA
MAVPLMLEEFKQPANSILKASTARKSVCKYHYNFGLRKINAAHRWSFLQFTPHLKNCKNGEVETRYLYKSRILLNNFLDLCLMSIKK